MPAIGIGIGLPFSKGYTLLKSVKDKLLFLGYTTNTPSSIVYNILNYEEYLSIDENSSYACPNTSTYINADTDYIWFNQDLSQRNVTIEELIGYDFSRTFVKYLDNLPYTISVIGIAKEGETFSETEMNNIRNYFHLSVWWDNTLSNYGNVKGNRWIGKSYWIPEVIVNVPTNLTLSLISGGVNVLWTDTNSSTAQTEIYSSVNGIDFSLVTTENEGVVTKDLTVSPVNTIYYKVRALKSGVYSEYTGISQINMCGAEKVVNGGFDTDSTWVKQSGYTISNGLLNVNASAYAQCYQNCGISTNKTYKVELDLVRTSGILTLNAGGYTSSPNYSSSQHIKWIIGVVSQSNGWIHLVANATLVGTIDNVSVREVLNP